MRERSAVKVARSVLRRGNLRKEVPLFCAYIVGTGRSDFPNQINNVLAFPGIFRGALDAQARKITVEMQIAAAKGIASLIPDEELSPTNIIPDAFQEGVAKIVANSVKDAVEAKRVN